MSTKTARRSPNNVKPVGFCSEDYFALVHKQIDISVARGIPEAAEKLQAEWDKLASEKVAAWDLSTVREKEELIREIERDPTREAHFGSLMELCHLKNAELSKQHQRYKGRVVFRGDNVRDKEGYLAVFSEQGTGASHQAAAKFLDAIARLPGNDGEEALSLIHI